MPFFALECVWEKLLIKHGIDYFKASACEIGKKPFEKYVKDSKNITPAERKVLDGISLEFIDAIVHPSPFDSQHYLTACGVGLLQEDFYEVIKEPHAKAVLGDNPYRLAYDLSFVASAWLMKQLGEGWGISIVADEHEIYSPLAPETYRKLKDTNPKAAEYLLSFSSVDEKKCVPLQAADAFVYEVRRALNTKYKIPGLADSSYRKQFEALTHSTTFFPLTGIMLVHLHLAERRKSVFLTVANSYMDESFDPKQGGKHRGFFVVARINASDSPARLCPLLCPLSIKNRSTWY